MLCSNSRMRNLSGKKQYDLVSDDGYDSHIPLHNEDAFQHGLTFVAKYIGTLDVPRPSSRVEIVAAMRRIRYEFKAKAIKKKKVNIIISTDGVKIMLSKKRQKKKPLWVVDETNSHLMVMHHPIYRIFYVSHDSQDLKIFSYIARDGSTNVFKCNVFKAYKKNQAMRIVRTIGQAFEVCHKISLQTTAKDEEGNEGGSEKSNDDIHAHKSVSAQQSPAVSSSTPKPSLESLSPAHHPAAQAHPHISPVHHAPALSSPQSPEELLRQAQNLLSSVTPNPSQTAGTISSPTSPPLGELPHYPGGVSCQTPLSSQHQYQLLRQQLEQQVAQTQVALAQVTLLRDQLTSETAARMEAQARTHQLLIQNRELLEHINTLVGRLQYLEVRVSGTQSTEVLHTISTQLPVLTGATTPEPGVVISPNIPALPVSLGGLFENTKTDSTESPDSGHREMSSDSLAQSSGGDVCTWYAPGSGTHTSTAHGSIYRSVSSNGYSQGPMTSANRPELVLPLRTSSNPFTPHDHGDSDHQGNYENIKDKQIDIITPLPMQDASGNRLELTVAPKIDPPPKVHRRSSRTPSGNYLMSPDANGNHGNRSSATSQCSSVTSDNSFEHQLNQLLEQATGQAMATEHNIINERKELNTLPKPDKDHNKNPVIHDSTSKTNSNVQNSNVNNLSTTGSKLKNSHPLPKHSFSDEENTEEVELDDDAELKNVLNANDLSMFTELHAFSS